MRGRGPFWPCACDIERRGVARGRRAWPRRSRRRQMASKAKATQAKEEAPEKDAEGAPEFAAAAARSFRRRRQEDDQGRQEARLRHLRSSSTPCCRPRKSTSEQIEDILAMLNEMGINVVETEEGADDEEGETEKAADEPTTTRTTAAASWSRPSPRRWPSPRRRSRPSAPTIRCACICARWARSSCSRARAKSPSPSASRPAARR